MSRLLWAAALILSAVSFPGSSGAEERNVAAEVGRWYFERHCSACHGLSGRGDGPVVSFLKAPPPDLTAIAARSGGRYPATEVAQIIDGRREIGAHGRADMPVWGERFGERMTGPVREAPLRGRIALLVEYIRTIQAAPDTDE